MSCLRERVYDRFKQTWLASRLFYYGQRYRHIGPITINGTVAGCAHRAGDGDHCFDVVDSANKRWHCEVTECQSALWPVVDELKLGELVHVAGTHTFDPPHHIGWKKFQGGGDEVHPVIGIYTLKTIEAIT